MDLLENYLHRQKTLAADKGYFDIQQAGLYEFNKLSVQSVEPVTKYIESRYNNAKKAAEFTYNQAKESLDSKYMSASAHFQTGSIEQIEALKKDYEQQKHNLEGRIKEEKKEAAKNTEFEITRFRENYEYEVMIAEVVQKGSLQKGAQKIAEIRRSVSAKKDELSALYKNAEDFAAFFKIFADSKTDTIPVPGTDSDPMTFYQQQRDFAEFNLNKLFGLLLPKLFLSAARYAVAALLCIIFAAVAVFAGINMSLSAMNIGLILLIGLPVLIAVLFFLGKLLHKKALLQIEYYFLAVKKAAKTADAVLDNYLQKSLKQIELEIEQAKEKCRSESDTAAKRYHTLKAASEQKNAVHIKTINDRLNQAVKEAENSLNEKISQIEQQESCEQKSYRIKYNEDLTQIQTKFNQTMQQVESECNSSRQYLKNYWLDGLKTIRTMLTETNRLDRSMFYNWQEPFWPQWNPSKTPLHLIRIGEIKIDFNQIAEPVRELMDEGEKNLETVIMPAALSFPNHCSLFVQTPHRDRNFAINIIKAAMIRLFTSIPAGQIHFNIFDPIGLGKNFVGFMHAVDYEKNLVGGRIWTDSEHIQRCLVELTTHMENVIQKYLRNEFDTIEAYNRQAGELAEPYRFLVIADFPVNFNDESLRRLNSIITSGPRCGVYTLIMCDDGQKMPEEISIHDLAANGIHLIWQKERFVWQNEFVRKFPLAIDDSPAEEILTDLVRKIGAASIDSARVEIPFAAIVPPEDKKWSENSAAGIKVPIGRSGAKRLQYLELGKGVNQHILIAGKTGSGKSTLFHIIITNLALWYSPDEVELYLIDFKQGVEFKTYATHKLPHVRAVAIESDREFGLSILEKLDAEMIARGEKFRYAKVQDISSYRQITKEKLPRTILIIDEFHILFAEDDKISHSAAILLEKLVRQGRAFGIHIILGSQSMAGISGISRSIMGQMAVRIALQCSEIDSQIIFNEDNLAARLLARPGEAIYNDAGGMIVGNNPFQVAWLPKTTQDQCLAEISGMPNQPITPREQMIIFEGNVPAEIADNQLLAGIIRNPFSNNAPVAHPPYAWLGEPVSIKAPTAAIFNRQNGSNLLLTGRQDTAMAGVLSSALLSLLAGLSPEMSKFTIMAGDSADSLITMKLKMLDSLLPNRCSFVQFGQVEPAITELAAEVRRRLETNCYDAQIHFLIISGLQRYRMLYKKEDDWTVGADAANSGTDKLLEEIICNGPAVGIHTIIGADTFGTVEKVVGRKTLGEFNNRVLFQMSAADSSSLIDTPIANKLGFQQALFYNQEQGVFEKFRFYAPPQEQWLKKQFSS